MSTSVKVTSDSLIVDGEIISWRDFLRFKPTSNELVLDCEIFTGDDGSTKKIPVIADNSDDYTNICETILSSNRFM
jgi:hypothetical protein